MRQRTRRPAWHHMVAALVAGVLMGAGSGAVVNARNADVLDVSTFTPASPVSGEEGAPRPVVEP